MLTGEWYKLILSGIILFTIACGSEQANTPDSDDEGKNPEDLCHDHGSYQQETISCICDVGYQGDTCVDCAEGYQDYDEDGECQEACAEESCAYLSDEYLCDDSGGAIRCVGCDYVHPQRLGSYQTFAHDLVMSEGLAYVAAGSEGLRILDVSDPEAILLVGQYQTEYPLLRLKLQEKTLYLATDGPLLEILDVSDSVTPTWLGSHRLDTDVSGVFPVGNLLYVAKQGGDLVILDVTDPSVIHHVTNIVTEGTVSDIRFRSGYAYILDQLQGLLIYDLSNAAKPSFVGIYEDTAVVNRLDLEGDRLYLTDSLEGLSIINIVDPRNPVWMATKMIPGESMGLDVRKGLVYVSYRSFYDTPNSSGYELLDARNPNHIEVIRNVYMDNHAQGIRVEEDIVYIANTSLGLMIYDSVDCTCFWGQQGGLCEECEEGYEGFPDCQPMPNEP